MTRIVKAVILVALLMTVINTSEGAPGLITKLVKFQLNPIKKILDPLKLREMIGGGGGGGSSGGGSNGGGGSSGGGSSGGGGSSVGQKPPQSG
ncbi:DEAD-box ATP-dependent RNA helicase 7-like isoform X2 [Tribolium madens]|uniref:DEAD-box ATP-dependent RNA helicase 7-like isoform X2 n=1 Tax=Tribolium madens TaxID=41895 RepID=UPI001CF7238F|nr:DEAD-box ATP-dependent RNA helicase 7-like isoform X2 [Tribolium madens]